MNDEQFRHAVHRINDDPLIFRLDCLPAVTFLRTSLYVYRSRVGKPPEVIIAEREAMDLLELDFARTAPDCVRGMRHDSFCGVPIEVYATAEGAWFAAQMKGHTALHFTV